MHETFFGVHSMYIITLNVSAAHIFFFLFDFFLSFLLLFLKEFLCALSALIHNHVPTA